MGMLEQKIVLQAGTKGMEPVVWAPQNDSGRLLRCVLADLDIPNGTDFYQARQDKIEKMI